jgi:enoyl-CoA hydratase
MTEKLFIETRANGVTILTINRPEARNALSLEMMRAFADAVAGLERDSQLRAVVLTGAGDEAFCSGGDLVELSGYPSEDDARMMIGIMSEALLKLERLPVLVIAAVNGYALGGGAEIAVACDLRVVDENARMGFVQIRNGLTPGWGAGQRLLRLVGYARAMELLLSGQLLSAAELKTIGLVNRVVPRGQTRAEAISMAERIAASPPEVVGGIKRLLQAGLTETYERALQIEQAIFPPLWAAEPHVQAVEQFLSRTSQGR